ncbi:CMP-sialic acid transporter 1-like isoform X3 [Apium graveolens]|uniref:CMP-sialic acid transporter 1-like isoform X3 n=1 Tax=Apium graveolens TaxID=4045 RepID=UPI003D79E42F
MQWYVVASLLTVLTSSQGILTTLSQSNGSYKYDYATVPFLAEVFKLLVSSILLRRECLRSPPPLMTTEWKSIRLYPIPSIIYLIHNNVQFATLTYVDTSTYQIMGNLKIVTTAVLFRLFLRRKLSNLQWMAIFLLAIGTTTSQVKGCGEASCDSLFSSPIPGYMLGVLSACLSALAGIYTEFLLKKNNDTLYWQNVQLYTHILHVITGFIFFVGFLFSTSNKFLCDISSKTLHPLSVLSSATSSPSSSSSLELIFWHRALYRYQDEQQLFQG